MGVSGALPACSYYDTGKGGSLMRLVEEKTTLPGCLTVPLLLLAVIEIEVVVWLFKVIFAH